MPRRGWIAERIRQLAAIFAIDVAADAVMSNHYFVEVRIDRERALVWPADEGLKRWTALFTGPYWVSKYLSEARAEMRDAEIATVTEMAETYRARLIDLSWFIRTLNEGSPAWLPCRRRGEGTALRGALQEPGFAGPD